MEPYEINLVGEILTVQPEEDGTYLILRKSNQIARLYPDVTVDGVQWETGDLLDPDYVKQIGELIEEHEM